MWDPDTYLAFDDHRGRPFYDLLARVNAEQPRTVVDIGCGPGNLAQSLARRWPGARICGMDSSPEMVAAAVERGVHAFVGDVREWMPDPGTDVVVCNAVLQWVPDHRDLLRRWIGALDSGAWLAFQVPGNFAAPSHRLIRELVAENPWQARFSGISLRGEVAVHRTEEYAELLLSTGCAADVWETTYFQQLSGADPVLEWVRGTALRPISAELSEQEFARFRADLAPRLRAAYPRTEQGTVLFPFRRIFAVAHIK